MIDSLPSLLLCNAGSSSLKLAGCSAEFSANADARVEQVEWQVTLEGSAAMLLQQLLEQLEKIARPDVVVHRVVHAGLVSETAQRLDAAMLARIAHWAPLAPLHNPLTLRLIAVIAEKWPHLPQYAVFDSGLYAHLPAAAAHYALPAALSPRWPLRRYGFHGLAHRSQWYCVQQASAANGIPAPRRLISLQLGSGCSVTAWRDDQAVDTTMGFTPLEGVVMATRSGSVDPGLLLHLLSTEGMTVTAVQKLLSEESGLAALAAGRGDMRAIVAAGTVEADAALKHYCHQLRKAIGAALAVLGGVDAISIGGGVGENQPQVRELLFCGLEELGISLDRERNLQARGLAALHEVDSRCRLWLTPVNEMTEMIRQYRQLQQTNREIP